MITRYASKKEYWLIVSDNLLTKQYVCYGKLLPYPLIPISSVGQGKNEILLQRNEEKNQKR